MRRVARSRDRAAGRRVSYPRIVERKHTRVSPWVTLVEKAVQFAPDQPSHLYHCLTQADYVAVLALTPDGRIPLVRQYRPAVEDYTWELPAGTVDSGETPDVAVRRELREEAGLEIERLVYLGCFIPDTGRLQVNSHAFFARATGDIASPPAEPGLEVRLVTVPELRAMIRSLEFRHQLHCALYAAAMVHEDCGDLAS